jgi:hypothetical protein
VPSCRYEQDFTYPTAASVQASNGPDRIQVEHRVCPAGAQNLGAPFAFMSTKSAPPAADMRALVDRAEKAMDIPLPQVSLSPAADATQYVGLPVWAWVSASAWRVKSVSVSAGGVSLTMTATPTYSVWSMGDGESMTCRGPGTPYPTQGPPKPSRRESPDCGYTYGAPSTSRPGGTYPVSVTGHWKVAWTTTNGLSGSEPELTTTSSFPVTVSEIEGLVTDVRP